MFGCGAVVAHKWEEFNEKVTSGVEVSDALDQVGLERYCCEYYDGHLDLIHKVTPQRTTSIIGEGPWLAWPILGG